MTAEPQASPIEKTPLVRYVPPAKPTLVGLSRADLAEALGRIGDTQVIPTLRKVLVDMKAHSPLTRQRAIEALRRVRPRNE